MPPGAGRLSFCTLVNLLGRALLLLSLPLRNLIHPCRLVFPVGYSIMLRLPVLHLYSLLWRLYIWVSRMGDVGEDELFPLWRGLICRYVVIREERCGDAEHICELPV